MTTAEQVMELTARQALEARLRRLALLLVALVWIFALGGVALTLAAVPLEFDDHLLGAEWASLGLLLGYSCLVAVILTRMPTHPIGWLLLGMAVSGSAHSLSKGWATASLLGDLDLPGGTAALWLHEWIGLPATFILFLFLPLLFPTGRPLTPRWRWLLWTAILSVGASVAADAMLSGPLDAHERIHGSLGIEVDNPFGVLNRGFVDAINSIVAFLGLSAIVSLFVRFRRSRGDERQQLKWFILSVALLIAGVTALGALFGEEPWFGVVFTGLLILPAIGITIAVLRFRLYDIDRLISRTVAYTVLTGVLVGVYLGVVLLIGLVLQPLEAGSDLSVAGSVLVVAALFNPVRRRIQGAVDARFNRAHHDAEQTVVRFGTRLREEIDLETLTDELETLIGETMEPTLLTVQLVGAASASPTHEPVDHPESAFPGESP